MIYKKLSIIIPVYNEEKTILNVLHKISTVNLTLKKEIIIVNDGSTDNSEKIIKEWLAGKVANNNIFYLTKENGGKGSAVRHGIENSTGDIVIIQDADLEYNPEEINYCIQPIIDNKAKVVYGSRELSGKKRRYSYISFFMGGLIVTNWINFLFGTGLTDEPTCYKTFDGNLIRCLLFNGNGFEWEPEITCKLIRLGFDIYETGISYTPRNLEEGKKINAFDGFKALWVILVWRFAPIKKESIKLNALADKFFYFKRPELKKILFFVFFIALLLRALILIPGINDPKENYSRPDSSTYLNPAETLAETGDYKYKTDTESYYAYRAPGYPFYLALFYKFTDNLQWPVIFMCIISALTCVPIFYSGYNFGGKWTGFIAGLLFAFNVTSASHAPLLLSDTLFTFIIAVQFFYFIKFYFTKRSLFLFISVFLASISAYIRPIEILWFLPCLFLVFIFKEFYLKKKISVAALLFILFFIPLLPWMARNYVNKAGFSLSTDAGNLLYNNGAVLLGKIEKRSPEKIREEMHKSIDLKFKKNPDIYRTEAARVTYEKNKLLKLILKYPFTYFALSLRPWVLLPDLPTFYQVLGITVSGKGTFDILNTKGIFAAVSHYFKGKTMLLFLSLPLLLIVGLTYLGCLLQFLKWLFRKQWFLVFTAIAFIEYFLFLPGPIAMPRYHLPALPMMCVMAALFIFKIIKHVSYRN
ncbi:MAG: glycosyltransferase [Victivallales bacterium]|nr:glycosyltransferase [Victivallales bacterium]MCF7889019.1 glycosyltransferase [Victivallales bacterium]